MKVITVSLLVLLLVPATALAWSETYSWAAQPTGTTYNAWICDWVPPVAPATVPTPCATWVKSNASALTVPTYTLTDSNPVLTQIEVEACNAIGCSHRFGSGFFHDASRTPASPPASVLAQ